MIRNPFFMIMFIWKVNNNKIIYWFATKGYEPDVKYKIIKYFYMKKVTSIKKAFILVDISLKCFIRDVRETPLLLVSGYKKIIWEVNSIMLLYHKRKDKNHLTMSLNLYNSFLSYFPIKFNFTCKRYKNETRLFTKGSKTFFDKNRNLYFI